MNELQKHLSDGKKSITQIMNYIEYHKVDIPVMLDLEQILDLFKYMDGFIECLIKHNLLKEQT